MPQNTSTRLPGVPQLQLHFTGPEYSRWRRSIKFALQAKGTWKYCNGNCSMPMPEAAAASPSSAPSDLQPSLLDERRDWVRHDREAKLDIFLSLSEDVMQDVLEVGPPLPPSSMNAQEMLQTLDERFAVFKFEAYHHAFCHFLNLHIDQFPSLQEFNQEFTSTLEDLLDHGHPLSNIQACSAYFSKLRCTQNPWVAKKLAEWDAQDTEAQCSDLMKESPLWSIIRPLTMKASQTFQVESIPEEHLEDSSASDSDTPLEDSDTSTTSSVSIHSRQNSKAAIDISHAPDVKNERKESVFSTRSQEITISANSGDIAESKSEAQGTEPERPIRPTIPGRGISQPEIPLAILNNDPEAPLPEWLASKKSIARPAPQAMLERPLPPLPTEASRAKEDEQIPLLASSFSRSTTELSLRSTSSLSNTSESSPRSATPPRSSSPRTSSKRPSQSSLRPQPSTQTLQLETTHPTLRPADVHPALRPPISSRSNTAESIPTLQRPTVWRRNTPDRPSTSSPNLAIPWPSTPDLSRRHSLSDSVIPAEEVDVEREPEVEDWSLPLQGTRDSAWAYLYESKGGYLVNPPAPSLPHSISPMSSTSPLLPAHSAPQSLLTQSLQRLPNYEDTVVSTRSNSPTAMVISPKLSSSTLPALTFGHKKSASTAVGSIISPASVKPSQTHKKSSSLDFMSRLSGDSLLESSEETRERERARKKKSWVNLSVNMNAAIAKFQGGGVREINA